MRRRRGRKAEREEWCVEKRAEEVWGEGFGVGVFVALSNKVGERGDVCVLGST